MPPWSVMLFAGDLFGAIPFGVADSTEVRVVEEPLQHFMGEVAFGYGLLISPTCDMYEASYLPEVRRSHPFRVLVPILPLATVIDQTTKVEQSENLIRKRDALQAYMYLPPLAGLIDESVACLFRPSTVADNFLANPPRRIAQMSPLARRHLKIKLAAYWGRVKVAPDQLDLRELNEESAQSGETPVSRYDAQ